MFVYITNQDIPVTLQYPFDNHCGFKVALHEIFYKVKWFNISEKKENNWIEAQDVYGNKIKGLTIPDGYYGFCALKEMLSDFGIVLKLSQANLKITLTFKPDPAQGEIFNFAGELARMLGFETKNLVIYGFNAAENITFEGQNPVNLAIHSLLYVQLDELSTEHNLYDGRPSTVLRVLPAGTAAYCDHEIKTFTNLQFKNLALGHHEKLTLRITDQKGKRVKCEDLHVLLEIIEN